jgi:hypothetical protein
MQLPRVLTHSVNSRTKPEGPSWVADPVSSKITIVLPADFPGDPNAPTPGSRSVDVFHHSMAIARRPCLRIGTSESVDLMPTVYDGDMMLQKV